MFESLKAEQFLRARQELIAMQEQILEAAGTLDEAWKVFDENNQALNAEWVKSADDYMIEDEEKDLDEYKNEAYKIEK